MKLFLMTLTVLITILASSVFGQCGKEVTFYGTSAVPSGSVSFGKLVGPAGDVDNDGHPDYFVGASDSYPTATAGVRIISGLTDETIIAIDGKNAAIYAVSEFGDYNGDDHDDILMCGAVHSGLTGEILFDFKDYIEGGYRQRAISDGDINDDGIHDAIIPNYQ